MDTSTHDHEPSTVAYVPRHLAVPDVPEVPAGGGESAVDPRSSRWDRSVSTLTRLLDELTTLDDDDRVLAAAR